MHPKRINNNVHVRFPDLDSAHQGFFEWTENMQHESAQLTFSDARTNAFIALKDFQRGIIDELNLRKANFLNKFARFSVGDSVLYEGKTYVVKGILVDFNRTADHSIRYELDGLKYTVLEDRLTTSSF